MTSPIRWGILGTGNIAGAFAEGLGALDGAELVAVGSRSPDAARAFGERFGVSQRYASYAALARADVDVIYVATPHPFHKEHALLCLEAGKAVLCEKPFCLNAGEAEEVAAAARERGLFLMEGMWTRFFPAMVRVRELLAAGAIGTPRLLTADFGFRVPVVAEGRLFNPELGGGALLDVGVYLVSLASMVFGAPREIRGSLQLGDTGVDEQSAVLLGFEQGHALLAAAIRTATPQEALLIGTDGLLRLHGPWWKPSTLTLTSGGETETLELPFVGNGFNHEAAEVSACLRAGRLESKIMPLDETLSVMRTLDELRAQGGLYYPTERATKRGV